MIARPVITFRNSESRNTYVVKGSEVTIHYTLIPEKPLIMRFRTADEALSYAACHGQRVSL